MALVGQIFSAAAQADCETAAYYYADAGMEVLPIEPGEKRPALILGDGGHANATTNEDKIAEWWAKNPAFGVGIKPAAAGVVVIDIDGKPGRSDWEELGQSLDDSTPTTQTPGRAGGFHRYYKASAEQLEIIGGSAKIGKRGQVEVIGTGKYVLETPTMHPDGKPYTPLHSPDHFLQLPMRIIEQIQGKYKDVTIYGSREQHVHCRRCLVAAPGVVEDIRSRGKGFRGSKLFSALNRLLELPHVDNYGEWLNKAHEAYIASHHLGDKPKKQIMAEWNNTLRSVKMNQRQKGGYGTGDCMNRQEYDMQQARVADSDKGSMVIQPRLKRGSEIQSKQRHMLWKQLIPDAAMTIIAGMPQVGKTSIARWVASELVSGTLDNETTKPAHGSVLWITAEESVELVAKPALEALLYEKHGEQRPDLLDQVFFEDIEEGSDFAMDDDGVSLNAYLESMVTFDDVLTPKMVVVDSYDLFQKSAAADTNNLRKTKQGVSGFIQMAQAWNVALVIIEHTNKAEWDDPMKSISGSIGKTAMARAVLGVGYHPDDRDARVVSLIKGSYASRDRTDAEIFYIEGKAINIEGPEGLTESVQQGVAVWKRSERFPYKKIFRTYSEDS